MLLSPAMKTMETLRMVLMLVLLTSCRLIDHYNDHIIIAVRDIPSGTVLQRSDFNLDHGWRLHEEGACLSSSSNVIGHKTLRPILKGKTIHPSDIEGGLASCGENVADGWSGWQ